MHFLLQKAQAVLREPPSGQRPRLPLRDRHDDVGVKRQGMFTVKFRWNGRMIGVRMVIADDIHTFRQRSTLRPQGVVGGDNKAVLLLFRFPRVDDGENRRHAAIALRR